MNCLRVSPVDLRIDVVYSYSRGVDALQIDNSNNDLICVWRDFKGSDGSIHSYVTLMLYEMLALEIRVSWRY